MTYFDQLTKKAQSFDQTIKQVHAYSGSPRKGGNTDTIIKQILKGVASEKINTYSTNLSSIDFKGCIGCEKCRKDKVCTMLHDGMSILYPDIIDSRGLILASPVHNYNVTSLMKALGFDIVGILPVFLAFEKGAVKNQKNIMDKAYDLGTLLGKSLR